MFTPAGAQSRVKRSSRTSRLASTDQPAIPLVGPPSYSYGSPNTGLPAAPSIRDTGVSMASAFNEAVTEAEIYANLNRKITESLNGDDITSQYSSTSSRTPRRRAPSVQEVEASINRRRSLRSGSRSVDLASVTESIRDDESLRDDEPGAISLDYDVTQSSLNRTFDDYEERPSKVSQYEESSFIASEDKHESVRNAEKPRSSSYLESLTDYVRFLRFLLLRMGSQTWKIWRMALSSASQLAARVYRWARRAAWIIPCLLFLALIPMLVNNSKDIASHLRFRPSIRSFTAPSKLPGSPDELTQRLLTVEQSLDKHWKLTDDLSAQLVGGKEQLEKTNALSRESYLSIDGLQSRANDVSKCITDLQERLSDLDTQWRVMDKRLHDLSVPSEDPGKAPKHSLPGIVETDLQDVKQDLQSQRDLLLELVTNSSRDDRISMSVGDTSLQKLVKDAVHKHSLDVLAQPDYASYLGGARVNPFLTSSTYLHQPSALLPRLFSKLLLGIGSVQSHPPATAIHPSNDIGMCWAFPGSKGQLSVKLSHAIRLSDIAVEHIHPDIAHDPTTAPKDIEIWAQVAEEYVHLFANAQDTSTHSILRNPPTSSFVHIMDITYDIYSDDDSVQTFAVPQKIKQLDAPVRQLVYRFLTNWGNEEYTCVYRVRALGLIIGEQNEAIEDDEFL